MTTDQIKEAIKHFETPFYLFDLDEFRSRFFYMKQQLGEAISVNYCMKTNPFLIRASLPYTDRVEVCSFGEFLICRELKIPPSKLLISGVLKKKMDMEVIISHGGSDALYTAESLNQLEVLQQIAVEKKMKLSVYYRLNCNQFGMDEDTIIDALKSDAYPNLDFYGIHYFTGTQKQRLVKHEKELKRLDAFFGRIETETGQRVAHLEYGCGFGVSYFENQTDDICAEESLKQFRQFIANMNWRGTVSIELGRALAYDCGYYVTTALDVKSSEEKNYVICDGGIHQINYDGQLRGMYQPHLQIIRNKKLQGEPLQGENPSSEKHHYTLCGSLCTVNDVLVSDLHTEEIQEGDYIVFERVGAYSIYEGMSLFLSHELPGVILVDKNEGMRLTRKQQETYKLNTPEVV